MSNRILYWAAMPALSLALLSGVALASPANPTTSQQTTAVVASQAKSGMPNMAKLMANKSFVKSFQRALVSNGATIAVDGVCGKNTIDALRAFQKAHGLKVTGMIDPETVKALGVRYPTD